MKGDLLGKRILLGVSGGIAVYKACDLVRKLKKEGADLRVVLTTGAEEFVKPALFSALSGAPCYTNKDFFTADGRIPHIELARFPDLILLVPATASLISKLRCGQSSELLLAILLATKAQVFIFPSMNATMYNHPAVQENLSTLKAFGYKVFPPYAGELACGEVGEGRLPEPDEINEVVKAFFKPKDLVGRKFLITAGPTREYLDEVRFITNASTGRMGYLIAKEVYARGGEVYLVWGKDDEPEFPNLEPLHGIPKPRIYRVRTTEEMFLACENLLDEVDVCIFAGAPTDFKPKKTFPGKIKKGQSLTLELVQTVDIAKTLQKKRKKQLMVGFALEEEDKLEVYAKKKLLDKGFDLIVANPISTMGSKASKFLILGESLHKAFESLSKEELAKELVDLISQRLKLRAS
ncbi:MAG: bifunctional phosphopantothenoylcysteine decarboxylase/phosphopantothenate--cysteine ligase CoaBC [Thermodesulfobacterium sp.]|jgi:phosphopantothenoylcysteine decarboxylase/phosphopantothenate--cysteine ligase|nr:bifunctional phosphopantothenoylcysteine decarboxylase/phosphopantothenate--cysteine ligase CoaBC [Thermodesulfobacterium sp.]